MHRRNWILATFSFFLPSWVTIGVVVAIVSGIMAFVVGLGDATGKPAVAAPLPVVEKVIEDQKHDVLS